MSPVAFNSGQLLGPITPCPDSGLNPYLFVRARRSVTFSWTDSFDLRHDGEVGE